MATSTLRFVIIVALVVGGVVVINQAFPEGGASGLPDGGGGGGAGSPSPSVTPTTTPTDGGGGGGGDGDGEAQVEGVVLGVYNGTSVTGLAGSTADKLVRRLQYDVPPENVGDTPTKPVPITTLYFVTPADRVEAEALAASFFKRLDVEILKLPANADVPEGVQVAIYLGNDYANSLGQ